MISLILRGKCNYSDIYINTLKVKYLVPVSSRTEKGIGKVTIFDTRSILLDRNHTEYDVDDDGNLDMIWTGVYIWNGEDQDFDENHIEKIIAKLNSFEVEVEDDVPEDYKINIDYLECTIRYHKDIEDFVDGVVSLYGIEDKKIENTFRENLYNMYRDYLNESFYRITYRKDSEDKFVKEIFKE